MTAKSAEPITYSLGKLYDCLASAFPEHRTDKGILDVCRLADDLELSHEAVYKWFRKNKLSSKAATRIVNLSKGRAKLEDLHSYVFS